MSNEVKNIDLKLDLIIWFNATKKEEENFLFLYHNQKTNEVIGAISEKIEFIISMLTDVDELPDKEKFREFILNSAINIINQYPKEYLETMTKFINIKNQEL